MNFKKPTLEDVEIIKKYLNTVMFYGCEFSVANVILWADYYRLEFCEIKDMMVCRTNGDVISYVYPIGKGDIKETVDILIDDCKKSGIPFTLHGITEEMAENLNRLYDGKFTFKFDDASSDYIYNSKDLITLVGKKFSSKRNHINKIENSNWQYEVINDDNKNDCIEMSKKWCRQNDCKSDEQKLAEMTVVFNALQYYKDMNLSGGLIRLNDEVIAFSIGERINDDVFVVHIEKAFSDIQGAYPLINREFIRHEASEYKYINREEDLGIEGLRRAKRSYNPVMMVKKAYGVYNG